MCTEVPLHIKIANSGIPDHIVLQLLDSVAFFLDGKDVYKRHSKDAMNKLYTDLHKVCHARDINTGAGIKVVTQTINLLV